MRRGYVNGARACPRIRPVRHGALPVAAILFAAGTAIPAAPMTGQSGSPPPPPGPPSVSDARSPASGVGAEPARPVFELEPVIVTATRTDKSLFDVPGVGNVLTSEDLAAAMRRTLPEALRDVPGVMVQKTGHGQGSPFIRGFTGFRTLLLIDGVRLNNSVFRDGPNQYWTTVDPYAIGRMEIVKGPASVLYGSDAIGGTVSVFTKGPVFGNGGFHAEGRGFYRVASAERSHTVRGEVSMTWDDTIGIFAGATIREFGDLESGSGRQPRTGYDQLGADFKVEHRPTPDTRIVVAHQRTNLDDAWRTHRTVYGRSFEGTTVGGERRRVLDQDRDLTYVQLHAEDVGPAVDAMRLSLSYHRQSEDRDRIRSDGRRDLQGFEVGTVGVSAQFETASPVGLWTYGLEYDHDRVESYRRDYAASGALTAVRIQGPVADDATYDLAGFYVQNDIPVTDALDLILGGRITTARIDADRVEDPVTGSPIGVSDRFSAVTGSARFVWRLDEAEHWSVFGGVAQGFRAPNLSDLTRFDSARSNEIEVPSPGLDPEAFVSYEIGVKARAEGFFAQASWFHTDIDDLIIRQPTGATIDGDAVVTKRNGGAGFVHGVEVQGTWRFHPDATLFGSFTWLEGEADTFPTAAPVRVREPLSRLAPATGRVGVRWDAPDRNLWLEGLVTIAATQDKLSSRDVADTQRIPPGGTPGFTVLTARGGWRLGPGLGITAAIENITDEDYRIHGSGVNEPGVNVVLGVEYTF